MESENRRFIFPRVSAGAPGAEVLVRICNLTSYPVDVLWMKRDVPLKYATLSQTEYIDIRTYENHPWVFCRSCDGVLFLGNGNMVYWPKKSAPNVVVREFCLITYPMHSLCEISARNLISIGATEQKLEILPSHLQSYVKILEQRITAYRNST